MGLIQGFKYLPALVAGEVTGLRCDDLHAGMVLDVGCETGHAVIGRRRTDASLKLDDLGVAADSRGQSLGSLHAFLGEIRSNESNIVFTALGERLIDVAVYQEHR